jgi:probable HAF family extracellular repeat protein
VLWQNGVVTDLGALPGNNGENSSWAIAINNFGLVVGFSENGAIDPVSGYPEVDAVVWKNGNISNLGTFGVLRVSRPWLTTGGSGRKRVERSG